MPTQPLAIYALSVVSRYEWFELSCGAIFSIGEGVECEYIPQQRNAAAARSKCFQVTPEKVEMIM